MIKELKLANQVFPNNIIQGPLAGISSAPFRLLTSRYSQPAFIYTEMISCKTLIHQFKFTQQRFLNKHPQEGPLCVQLSGNDPVELAHATKIITDHGADLIDLNCGCPVKKIRSKGAGSRLLTDTQKLYQLIQAMKQNTHLPVSIKIRVEGNSNEKFNAEIARVINDSDLDFLVVHGRHWTEHYETPCHYDDIKFFTEAVKIPVIGNGDIACITSLMKMFNTGCAGVMVSRAGVGQPWFIKKLMTEMSGQKYSIPSPKEISAIFIAHILQLQILFASEKLALLQARKLAKYYARDLSTRAEFCNVVNTCDNLQNLIAICDQYIWKAQYITVKEQLDQNKPVSSSQ